MKVVVDKSIKYVFRSPVFPVIIIWNVWKTKRWGEKESGRKGELKKNNLYLDRNSLR